MFCQLLILALGATAIGFYTQAGSHALFSVPGKSQPAALELTGLDTALSSFGGVQLDQQAACVWSCVFEPCTIESCDSTSERSISVCPLQATAVHEARAPPAPTS